MKRLMTLFAVVFALAGMARAEGNLSAFGAYWNAKDFDDDFGYGARLALGGKASDFEIRFSHFESLVQDKNGNLDAEVFPIDVGLVVRAKGQQLAPYLGGGVSYFILNENGESQEWQADDQVGWYLVGGFEYALGKSTALFVEALYRDVTGTVEDDDISNLDLEADRPFELSGFAANAGLAIRF